MGYSQLQTNLLSTSDKSSPGQYHLTTRKGQMVSCSFFVSRLLYLTVITAYSKLIYELFLTHSGPFYPVDNIDGPRFDPGTVGQSAPDSVTLPLLCKSSDDYIDII